MWELETEFVAHKTDLRSDEWDRVVGLFRSAFPGEEQWVSLNDLRRIAQMPEGRLTSFKLDGIWCGFMHWVETERVAYIAYLAIIPALRSRGVGSLALGWLREQVSGKPIALDVELLDENAPDARLRERRQPFTFTTVSFAPDGSAEEASHTPISSAPL